VFGGGGVLKYCWNALCRQLHTGSETVCQAVCDDQNFKMLVSLAMLSS